MTDKERMLKGELYIPAADPQLAEDCARSRRITRMYNATTEADVETREELIRELLGGTGAHFYIEPPFRCDYGSNIYIGDYFYSNFDCIILDVCEVHIGDHVMFGPRVGVYTAEHPIDPEVRAEALEYGKPVTIGNHVWVGANVVINPGVHIGDNAVIGSGSVVTKDIPDMVVAAGNPCQVIRAITEEDRKYWKKKKDQYYEAIRG